MKSKFLAPVSIVLIVIGLAALNVINSRDAKAQQNAKGSIGRFQISAHTSSSSAIKGCFVIDTTTGELWMTEVHADVLGNADGEELRKWTKVADGVPVSK